MTNWRTMVAGIAGALLVTVVPLLQGNWTWKDLAIGVAIALIGFFAKDFNITGIGSKATDKTALDATKTDPAKKDG